MPIYKLKGEIYDIPDNVVKDFENDNPDATISYSVGNDEYEIPISEREGFLEAFPDAVIGGGVEPEPQPEDTTQEEPQPVQEAAPTEEKKPVAQANKPVTAADAGAQLGGLAATAKAVKSAPKPQPKAEPKQQTQTEQPKANAPSLFDMMDKEKEENSFTPVWKKEKGTTSTIQPPKKEGALDDYRAEADQMVESMKRGVESTGKKIESQAKYREAVAPKTFETDRQRVDIGNAESAFNRSNPRVIESETRYNPVTAKFEKTYQNEFGEYPNRPMAQVDQNPIDAVRKDIAHKESLTMDERIAETKTDIDRIDERLKELGWGTLEGVYNEAPMSKEDYEKSKQRSKSINQLLAAKRDAEDRLHILEESKNSGTSGFWRNLWGVATNPITHTFGLVTLADNLTKHEVANDIEKNAPISKDEQELLTQLVTTEEARQMFGDDMNAMARWGTIAGEALPFIAEFILTGGFSGVQEGVSGVVTKGLAKATSTNLANKGFRSWLVKAIGTTSGDLASAAAMANTTGAAKTIADAIARHDGNAVIQDEKGEYHFGHYEKNENGDPYFVDGGKTWARSIYEAEAANTIEYYTEMLGEHFDKPLGGLASWIAGRKASKKATAYVLKKLGLGEVSSDLSQITLNAYGEATKNVLKKAKIDSIPAEILEEEANIGLNAFAVGDNSLSDYIDGRTQADIIGGMFFSVGFMQALPASYGVYKAGGYLRAKHRLDNSNNLASYRLTEDVWKEMRERIDNTTNDKIADRFVEVMNDQTLTQEQKNAVYDYLRDLTEFRGFNMGMAAQAKEISVNGTYGTDESFEGTYDYGTNTNYVGGYNAEADQRTDIKNGYEYMRQQVAETFSEEDAELLEQYPLARLRAIASGDYTDFEKRLALDFVNAKATYDGMMQRTEDDVNSRVELSNAMIDSRTHRDGMIHPVTINGDKKVYIVDGRLAQLADGSVDVQNSEPTLIVIGEDGKIEWISPSDITSVEESIDAEEERNTAAQAIRESVTQTATAEIEGTLAFNAGDQYDVIDNEGNAHKVTIGISVGLPEGQVLASIDGADAQPMSKEEIQKMANNANLARLAEHEQEKQQEREEETAQGDNSLVAGAPAEYTQGLNIVVRDEDGNEADAIVGGRVRYEDGEFVADEKGNMIEYLVGNEVRHDYIDDLNEKVVGYRTTEEETGSEQAVVEASPEQTGANEATAATTEEPVTETEPADTDAMPMNGEEPDFLATTPERGHRYLFEESGISQTAANNIVAANIKEQEKEVKKQSEALKKLESNTGTSVAQFKKKEAEIKGKLNAAQTALDYWKAVESIQNGIESAGESQEPITEYEGYKVGDVVRIVDDEGNQGDIIITAFDGKGNATFNVLDADGSVIQEGIVSPLSDIEAHKVTEEATATESTENNEEQGEENGENTLETGENVVPLQGEEQPTTEGTQSEREQYIAEHPLTEAEIDASGAPTMRKSLAKKYLTGADESELAKAAYTSIYNSKATAEKPATETPSVASDTGREQTPANQPTTSVTQARPKSETESASEEVLAIIAKMKKHKKNNGADAYSISNLTPEQIDDMLELVEAGAKLGYTILDGVSTKQEWMEQMRNTIGEPLKDATDYTDTEVNELLEDLWNAPYEQNGEEKSVGEWAAEKGITNESENGTEEGNGSGVTAQGELPTSNDVGGNTESGVGTEQPNDGGNTESGGETGVGGNVSGGNSESGEGQPTAGAGSGRQSSETGGKATGSAGGSRSGGRKGRTRAKANDGGTTNESGEQPAVPTGTADVGRSDVEQAPKKPTTDISKEKVPYTPSSIGGSHAIGSVVPSGIADAIANAFKRLVAKFKKSTLDFVRQELGYKTNEEMLSNYDTGKSDGLASEQVDAVALAIGKMKEGKSFIVGDMTGVGKGRTAAALIRWGLQHKKKVLFITESSKLFSAMYGDLKDIGCDYIPFVTNSDTEANITDNDGNKVVPKPSTAVQKALWKSEKDKLPMAKGNRRYDFVMTTYSQASNPSTQDAKRKLEWLKKYAKDAIVIMDESHNASGESNRGEFFREIAKNAGGVTFLSATYAKRPDNMLLYAIRSSMSELHMSIGDMLEGIKKYGVAMQELMASALFGSGEMIRRERDMTGVKTTWTDPKEIYSAEEYEQYRKTSDKTMELVNDIIDFQRTYVNPIVEAENAALESLNEVASMVGKPIVRVQNVAYKSQVSNIMGLMVYAMKAKKAAEMAIEQIKQGKKPVIAVENTFGSYIDELEGDIKEANFRPIFDKGIRFALKYTRARFEVGEDKKYHKVKESEEVFNAEEQLSDEGLRALENLRQRVADYFADTEKIDLTLSPIDLVKQMIADAGYSCGEITGRSYRLEKTSDGYEKVPFKVKAKEEARKYNGGSKSSPLPVEEQYQALVINVAGATGISLHSSKVFGNQDPRTMIILQPARDVNTEVQMRGRIDRTGQVHRGEYFYLTSPIPAEQKLSMMLKQKLASLDAQSVGTKDVSANKVESQDMDNKYGDEVCVQYLTEHLNDVNSLIDNGLRYNNKTREWEGHPGILYDVLKDIQLLPCEMQETIISELTQRYADQIEYLNQNGINDLETKAMNLEAVTIDEATFVKGKDNDSINEFAHDTKIERVEVNVLKKPMHASDIKKKMKELGSLDEDGLPKEGMYEEVSKKVREVTEKKFADRSEKLAEKEAKLEEKLRAERPQQEGETEEEWNEAIQNMPAMVELKAKHSQELLQYSADLTAQSNMVAKAAMYLKPARPYLVPLTDDVGIDSVMMYGRFIGFQMKNGDPRQVQAVFAVKDSRVLITIPIVNKNKVIDKIIAERGDREIMKLERDEWGSTLSMESRAKSWDEWWDKMIPKNTNRQIRYMITGNVLQACGSLGKYKGQIVTFTRKDKKTGEVTLERGMLLAEDFDPENFKVRRAVTKKDVWNSYDEIKDDKSRISCHREGASMVVKFDKRAGEKLVDHPAQKDEVLKELAMNGEIRPSGKTTILCVIKEDNVEKALEHLYKEYGYTREELFVMPDSTDKPDAIVHTNRPYQEIINEYAPKYGSEWGIDSKIREMLKRYRMDVNNEELKNEIREACMLRQAYLRQKYARGESNRLAWEVLVRDQNIEDAGDNKEWRERNIRIREAIVEELEYRGFKGTSLHLEQGKMTFDDVRSLFDQLNNSSTKEGKAKKELFEKVMAKVSKLPMDIALDETISNDTGGWAGGRVIHYNWKYMNADYIADQAKADTILHELIHTVTAYADRCVEDGLEHLLDSDMVDAINELHSIYEAIKNDPTFEHDGARAYGLSNVREMLSEIGSNSEFRADLKKTNLWARIKSAFLSFFGINNNPGSGAKQVNAFNEIFDRLEYLIENFKEEAWEEYYRGSRFGSFQKNNNDARTIETESTTTTEDVSRGTVVEFNITTYNSEKEQMKDIFRDGGWEEEQIDEIFDVADQVAEDINELRKAYGLLDEFSKEEGNPNREIFRSNPDYKGSWDYSYDCVKKEAMNYVVEQMVALGKSSHLGVTQIEAIKKILEKYGYLTPCVMCYVEAKRKLLKHSKEAEQRWNAVANAAGLSIDPIGESKDLTEQQRKALTRLASGKDMEKVDGGSGRVPVAIVKQIANLMLNSDILRGRFDHQWLMTPSGYTNFNNKFASTGIMSILSQGQYKGKGLLGLTPFSFRSISPNRLDEVFNPIKWANEGGMRQFSYEDARPIMFFDYYQQMLLLQAAHAPLQLYTKREMMPDLFGETGAMINQSLVVDIWKGSEEHRQHLGLDDNAYDEWLRNHAGLIPQGVLDGNGDLDTLVPYYSDDSFPVEAAMRNAKDARFGGRVGNTVVAPSDEFILWALNNPNIHQVLAYHAKGASPIQREFVGYDYATPYDNDYLTGDTNTNISDAQNGIVVEKGKLKWNTLLRKFQKEGLGAREAARFYADYCKKNGIRPMFEKFADHPEYYKLLVDFRAYDEQGNSVRQKAVKAVLPEGWQDKLRGYLGEQESMTREVQDIANNEELQKELRQATKYVSLESNEREGVMRILGEIYGKDNVYVLEGNEFDDALDTATEDGKAAALRDAGGVVYGFTKDGKIWLASNLFNAHTPLHEHAHIVMKVLEITDPKLHKRGVELWKGTNLWNKVVEHLESLGEETSDARVLSEVVSQFTGSENERLISEITGITDKNWLQRAVEWFNEVWNEVKGVFSSRLNQKDLDSLTKEQFASIPLRVFYDAEERKNYIKRLKGVQNVSMSADMEANDAEYNYRVDIQDKVERINNLPQKYGLVGAAIHQAVSSRDELENMRGILSNESFNTLLDEYDKEGVTGVYLRDLDLVIVFADKVKDATDGEYAYWHEQTHGYVDSLSSQERKRICEECLDFLRGKTPELYDGLVATYKESSWGKEACSFFIEEIIKKLGAERFFAETPRGNEILCNFVNGFKDYVTNERKDRNDVQAGRPVQRNGEDGAYRRDNLFGRSNQSQGDQTGTGALAGSRQALGVPYQGSKSRIASSIINDLPAGDRFVDLFSGGGAMTHAAINSRKYGTFHMNDINTKGQELFMQGVRGDWRGYDRTDMTEEEFNAIKGTPESLVWSFNGLGRTLAKNDGRNRVAEQVRRVQRLEELKPYEETIETSANDYKNVTLKQGDVVYADIPYENTDQSGYGKGKFNKQEFIEWAQAQDVPVFVSEYSMPEGWTEISSYNVQGMRGGTRKEKLFVQDKFADYAKIDRLHRMPTFYSNAERAVEDIKQEKATPEQWLAMITKAGGLKAGEDKWMGLSDWLKSQDKKSLTKQEVMDFIRSNRVEVQDVEYEEVDFETITDDELFADIIEAYQKYYDEAEDNGSEYPEGEAWENLKDEYGSDIEYGFSPDGYWLEMGNGYWIDSQRTARKREIQYGERPYKGRYIKPIDETRLEYTTNGLENKREIALVVPTIESWDKGDNIHFGDAGEGRAIAWIRFGETEGYDPEELRQLKEASNALSKFYEEKDKKYGGHGNLAALNDEEKEELDKLQNEARKPLPKKRVLVIDEIQSSRHQEGREKGYKAESFKDVAKEVTENFEVSYGRVLANPYDVANQIDRYNHDLAERLRTAFSTEKIPDAPFDKNWHELAMKRMLRYAAENGYDKIAWTKGEQQAERYNITKIVSHVKRNDTQKSKAKGVRAFEVVVNGETQKVFVNEDGTIRTTTFFMDDMAGKPLSEVFGKELATAMMAMEDGQSANTGDMKVGGDGMKGFYDQILPRFMDKYGKKWGVKTEEIELPNVEEAGRTMWSVDVTPEMKESVMQGQPMFRDGLGQITYEESLAASKAAGYTKKQHDAWWNRTQKNMRHTAEDMAEKMHISDIVTIVERADELEDFDSLTEEDKQSKGWFDPKTGKIVVILGNHGSARDVLQTMLHEGVNHYGLRKMFGKHFETFLKNVYNNASPEIRNEINKLMSRNGWNYETATEEYLGKLAEDTDFENAEKSGWWHQIKEWFLDMLRSVGLDRFFAPYYDSLSDNELRYILWRSYQNLVNPNRYRSLVDTAIDIAKQFELGVGKFAENAGSAERVAERVGEPTVTPEEDEAYNRAVENNDMDAAQRMVDEAAKKAGYTIRAYRGNTHGDKSYVYNGGFFTSDRKVAESYDQKGVGVYDTYLKMENPIVINNPDAWNRIWLTKEEAERYGITETSSLYDGDEVMMEAIEEKNKRTGEDWIVTTADDLAEAMKNSDKYDGVVINGIYGDMFDGSPSEGAHNEYIPKNPNQVKSAEPVTYDDNGQAIPLSERFNSRNNDIRYRKGGKLHRDGDFTPRDKAIARDEYERIVSSGSYQFREAVQDSMLGLRRAMESIDKVTRIEDVPDSENAYTAENAMSSANSAQQSNFFREYMMPLLNAIHDIAGDSAEKREELIDYMMAKHGLERNEKFAARDAREQADATDGDYDALYERNRKKDYSGLTALTGASTTFLAEKLARDKVEAYEAQHDTTDLWAAVNNATKTTLAKIRLGGLLSQERYEQIRDQFEYYIPLQGWDETTSDEVYGYLTSKDSPLMGGTIKHAYGRMSKADDPIATIAMMADDAIRQANRNDMKQRFLTFVENHPSDLVSVNRLWLQYDEAADEWKPVFADIESSDTPRDVERKVKAFEERMEQLAEAEPEKYKRGKDAVNIPYKVVKGNLREHQVLVKRDGETYVLTINGNPRAAQALNGLTNPDVEAGGIVGNILKAEENIVRFLSALYTTMTPDFVISNFFRDMLYSNCTTWVKGSPSYARTFHKNFGRVNPYIMGKLFKKWESGTLDESNELERQFKTFLLNGGETGYTNVRDIEAHKKAIAAELKRMSSTPRKAWRALTLTLDLMNKSVENCARFAAFLTSQEMGRSIGRSIYDAKEISVNFNKKGAGGKTVNAVGQTNLGKAGSYIGGAGRLLYVFWNAGVQGMTNFGRAARRNKGKFAAGAASIFSLGAIMPLVAMAVGGDDDDYYDLPEYVRRSNICFRWSKDMPWITIPLPIEFRALYGLGELATGVITGKEHYSNGELARNLISQVSQILPLDFMEGGGGLHAFIPSPAKPLVEAVTNKSWTGLPIYKDTPYNQNDPEYTKVYKNADKYIVGASKWLNDETRRDGRRKGWADVVNPSQIEYMLNGYFGGFFKVPNQLVKMAETAFGDREFDWRNMMLANRLLKNGDESTQDRKLRNAYFKYKEEYEGVKHDLNEYQKEIEGGSMESAAKANDLKNSEAYQRYIIFDEYRGIADALNDAANEATDEERKASLLSAYYDVLDDMVKDIESLNPKAGEHVDSLSEMAFNDSYGTNLRKKIGSDIARRLGGKDSYGSPDTNYGVLYEKSRDYVDIAADVTLQVMKREAKESGNVRLEKGLDKYQRKITELKNKLTGLHPDDDEVMERIRALRQKALDWAEENKKE